MHFKHSKMDRLILTMNYVFLGIAVLLVVVPLIYVVLGSFMEPTALLNKVVSLNPADYNVEGYKRILNNDAVLRGFLNAVYYSAAFAIVVAAVSVFAGFSLSTDGFVGNKFFTILLLFTLFFNGGLIPTYMVVKNLGMLDSAWAIIFPGALNVWNIILARTFFKGIPRELNEAAKVDGASEMRVFFNIVLPLSKPIIFVLALYAFVAQWNSFFDAMIYLTNTKLYPLQLVLRSILIQNQVNFGFADQSEAAELKRLSEIIKYAAIVISSLPLIVMYPFFQKYFEKGVLVGSLK